MHNEILTKEQVEILPFIKKFKKSYYLVGGTAIALHLGHRRSIDFDLYKFNKINKSDIKSKIKLFKYDYCIIHEDSFILTIKINEVQITFFNYPYDIPHNITFDSYITLPSLLDLSAMKAFALARRAKWKDYVDLYFILKEHHNLKEISERANFFYGDEFSEKLFRQQISYFKDISYTEQIEYVGALIPEEEIKEFLIDVATEPF